MERGVSRGADRRRAKARVALKAGRRMRKLGRSHSRKPQLCYECVIVMPPVGSSLMSMNEEDQGVVRGRTEVALAGRGRLA